MTQRLVISRKPLLIKIQAGEEDAASFISDFREAFGALGMPYTIEQTGGNTLELHQVTCARCWREKTEKGGDSGIPRESLT